MAAASLFFAYLFMGAKIKAGFKITLQSSQGVAFSGIPRPLPRIIKINRKFLTKLLYFLTKQRAFTASGCFVTGSLYKTSVL
jgi:hypothetical protein